MMEDAEIIKQILCHLDGWRTDEEIQGNDEITDMDYNKVIPSEEVLHFYNIAYNYALSYTGLTSFPTITTITTIDDEPVETTEINPQILNGIFMWSAGLLWRKYNVRSNDQIDDTMTIGYGDQLVIQAREILKQVKGYSFYAY